MPEAANTRRSGLAALMPVALFCLFILLAQAVLPGPAGRSALAQCQQEPVIITNPNDAPPSPQPSPDPCPLPDSDPGGVRAVIQFDAEPVLLSPAFVRQRVQDWLLERPTATASELAAWVTDLYLQAAYPGIGVQAEAQDGLWLLRIQEAPPEATRIRQILIHGGTPQDRYLTRHNVRQLPDTPLDREQLLKDTAWLQHNFFLPLQLRLVQVSEGVADLDIHIVSGAEYFPTGNLSLNDIVGLSVTAGLIVNNPLNSGQIVRAMGKRNNIPFPFGKALGLVQDWEYTLSWATTVMPIEGMSLGLNHYNKVDYIYPDLSREGLDLVWIRSFGADLYSGFPLWSDPVARRYLRGVFNLSLVEDRFNINDLPAGIFTEPSPLPTDAPSTPESLTQSGKASDLLLMPSLTISYSDIDDYRLPKSGSFLQGRLGGSVLDARFVQATLTGTSFWTPYADEKQQWTVLLRSAAGSTFGANPPAYRGFLNTGHWLVRGATQFSITEKHSLRLSEELHYIYKPTTLEVDGLSQSLFGIGSGGLFDGWALDLNVFLDEGAYWRDNIVPRSGQLSLGGGVNLITPAGSVLGVDVATPLYPSPGGISLLLRISAPLSFSLYSDWGNTNGYFLR